MTVKKQIAKQGNNATKSQAFQKLFSQPVVKAATLPHSGHDDPPLEHQPALLTAEQKEQIALNRKLALERQLKRKHAHSELVPVSHDDTFCNPVSPIKSVNADPRCGMSAISPSTIVCGTLSTPLKSQGAPPQVTPTKCTTPRLFDGLTVGGHGAFESYECESWLQYHRHYSLRYELLREAALVEARAIWSAEVAPCNFLRRLQDCKQEIGEQLVIVGLLFKEMKKRPNVIEQYTKDSSVVGALPEDVFELHQKFCTTDDELWLEDQSIRVKLLCDSDHLMFLCTGIVVAVRGSSTADGEFRIMNFCFPRPPAVTIPRCIADDQKRGEFVIFISKLKIGNKLSDEKVARDLFVEFLAEQRENRQQGDSAVDVKQVIICGGLFMGSEHQPFCRPDVDSLVEADDFLCKVGGMVPVDVVPGRNDITNLNLPQKPMLHHIFSKSRSCMNVKFSTNPHERQYGGVRVLGHSGQPVEDILRCTSITSALDALQLSLEARHLAPTAPDTLPMAPSTTSDPFVIESMPHIFFSGGETGEFKWHPCKSGSGGTMCMIVPDFSKSLSVIAVNLHDLQDVRIKQLGE
jgi:DNA polymerase delta subunit 2